MSLGTQRAVLVIEQYRTRPTNYRPVQNGMNPGMVSLYLTQGGYRMVWMSVKQVYI
jgi:hypothetical protein